MGRQRYTIGEKKNIEREAKKASLRSVAINYNVNRRCIRDWVHQYNAGAFDEESPSRFRLGGGGRRVACEELDSLLIAEVREVRSKYLRVAAGSWRWRQRSSRRWQSSPASLSRMVGLNVFFIDTI